ncbi:Hypothetical protein R9X50_00124900 [Acrodontium crateriforme]|uniref:Calcineurin-like phosphoesterase domain-containing protein n=1 Tax=Acrodontium crateriforme TaxID=150365 RepID=A0AAQ3LYS8_9PEZI|nr:Hypothetical protein R9X50_00124900 [Acrodontium crateriforme]
MQSEPCVVPTTITNSRRKVRFVLCADTHNAKPGEGFSLPQGDILIHAGDLTNQGTYAELQKALDCIVKADFKTKIIVAGNHDISLDTDYKIKYEEGWKVDSEEVEKCLELFECRSEFIYLRHSSVKVQLPGEDISVNIFGSPYSPDQSKQNWAFQYSEEQAEDLWSAIPADTDILITHTPPLGHCDRSAHWKDGGCSYLTKALERIKPSLHVCGHCHEGRGAEIIDWKSSAQESNDKSVTKWIDPGVGNKKQSLLNLVDIPLNDQSGSCKQTAIVNASIMAKSWGHGAKAFNKPVVIDIELPRRRE